MARRNLLYSNLVNITADYLGPAADRFIDRQISNHLQKRPEKLVRKDMDNLINWLKASFSIISDDKAQVDEYISRLESLVNAHANSR